MARQTVTVMCMHALCKQERDLPTTICYLSAQGALQVRANLRGTVNTWDDNAWDELLAVVLGAIGCRLRLGVKGLLVVSSCRWTDTSYYSFERRCGGRCGGRVH